LDTFKGGDFQDFPFRARDPWIFSAPCRVFPSVSDFITRGGINQGEEEDGMKKQLWKTLGFLAALLATSTALGQSNPGDTIADIPFAFTVANHTLPAGRYTVTRVGETTLRISGSHNQGTVVLTHAAEGRAPESNGKMVFHRYGGSYFLSEVWVAANGTGRKVFESRAEEEIARKRIEMEIAVLQISR
jgi:hypothetical protein